MNHSPYLSRPLRTLTQARADLARTRLSRGAKRLLETCMRVGLLPDGTTRSAQEMRKELDREEER